MKLRWKVRRLKGGKRVENRRRTRGLLWVGLLWLLLALKTSGGLRGDKGVNVELDILAWPFVHSAVEHVGN